MAAVNIKENTGEVVSDEQVNMAIRKGLEEVLIMHQKFDYPKAEI